MKLVVGAPIRDRAWILPQWFEHMMVAVEHELHISDVSVVFVGSMADPSFKCATKMAHGYGILVHWHEPADDDHGPYQRVWTRDRYATMAGLRNELLTKVREMEPDIFWSLDTDILVAENTLSSALRHVETFDAVGTKLYMTPHGRFAPSYGMLPSGGGLRRSDGEGVVKVDAIMASKVMTPTAYAVDYTPHSQGEDIGWSIAARAAGCTLGWDGTVTSKHVMSKDMLDVVDPRCGF
jgi:hypothetical protein